MLSYTRLAEKMPALLYIKESVDIERGVKVFVAEMAFDHIPFIESNNFLLLHAIEAGLSSASSVVL